MFCAWIVKDLQKVLKTPIVLTKVETEYPLGSLFMDVEDIPFEELLSLASDKVTGKP